MSSIEPNGRGGEGNGGAEVSRRLVIAGGDGTELLELGEEVLDEMARLIEVPSEVARQAAVCLGRNDCGLPGGGQWREDAFVGIESLVGDQRVSLHRGQELVGAGQIVGLPASAASVSSQMADRLSIRNPLNDDTP